MSLVPSSPKTFGCDCKICSSVYTARVSFGTIPIQAMIDSAARAETDAARLIVEAKRMLGTALSLLNSQHLLEQRYLKATASPYSSNVRGNTAEHVDITRPSVAGPEASPSKEGTIEPGPVRQVTNPFEDHQSISSSASTPSAEQHGGSDSPTRPGLSSGFGSTVRARAAELGILREQKQPRSPNSLSYCCQPPMSGAAVYQKQPSTPTSQTHQDGREQKTRFLVCDHCRSHGLRCNEASVCKECILREVPCTHRMCEKSSDSKEGCPRSVCFYVHEDWMPDVYGQHHPYDENWLVLPGKLREHHSAGPLSKISRQSEADIARAYHSVTERQIGAKNALARLVQSGAATWETVGMACKCQEIERENGKARDVEEKMRRMAVSSFASGSV